MSKLIKIAIAGVGTVGQGLLDLIFKDKAANKRKFNIEITAIASRKKLKIPKIYLKKTLIFKDAKDLLEFDNYDILVELIGGENGIAKDIIFSAIAKHKDVVTANKALVSKHWKKIKDTCFKNKSVVAFEAAVAGGIPIIKILNEFLKSNKIKRIYGILNGTSNFILTKMLETNKSFSEILKEAQNLGYAESDPSFDIDGIDTAHKLSMLSSLSYNNLTSLKTISIDGIRNIKLVDLMYAKALGYSVKLLGISQLKSNKIMNFVYPCLIEQNELIAKVDGVYNGIVVESDFCKKSFFQGEGAGSLPTATSVFSDIINITNQESKKLYSSPNNSSFEFFDINERFGSYYLRFTALDRPGVISGISNEFKKNNISMKSMLQKDNFSEEKKHATIVVTTHNCLEKNMMNALKKINSLNFILKKTVFIRIESF